MYTWQKELKNYQKKKKKSIKDLKSDGGMI